MADVREKLARLCPATARHGVRHDGGGAPELTNIDIAGALGMVPAGLGREVLEACWWPDGAQLRRHKLRDAIVALVAPEIRRQQYRLFDAGLELQLARQAIAWSRTSMTHEQRSALDQVERRYAQVQAQCWPRSTMESLPTLAGAVLSEIARANHCDACRGRGEQGADTPSVCPDCGGRGIVAVSDRSRARALGRDEAAYRKTWRPVYLWLLDRLLDAEQKAARALAAALRDEAA
jgi:hypothetical protein